LDLLEKLSRVPGKPGVYLFKDEKNSVLYVGKAKGLRNRLRSYFQKASALDERKRSMMKDVGDFEYTVTGNELEAFVLEANLIKQYRPRYNILLRDDKSYPYLRLTVDEKWPCLEVVRRIQKDGSKYYGPYVPSGPMWEILSFIRNHFPIRSCKYSLEKRMRACMQYQIKRCSAPCDGKISHGEYVRMVNEVKLLLEGKNKRLMESLQRTMERLSEEMRYEGAALVRDRIKAIRKISEVQKAVAPELGDMDVIGMFNTDDTSVFKILFIRNGIMIGSRHFHFRGTSGETAHFLTKNFIGQFYVKEIIPPPKILCSSMPEDLMELSSWLADRRGARVEISAPRRGMKRKLVEMAEENAEIMFQSGWEAGKNAVIEEIASFLRLGKVPRDIGAFDISNISGHEPVGAFVCWSEGKFIKEKYRHIKMDAIKGPDDYSMMKEMIKRTIKSLDHVLPDLMIIDGGRAHLDAALEIFEENKIDKDVVGVAKDPDRVFLKHDGSPLSLDDGKAGSLLLKRIRDEAHRFAIRYHKKLRSKRVFESPLEKIHGIGKTRRFALLRHFGSIEAIRNATVEQISGISGLNRPLAEKVVNALARDGGGKKDI